MGRTVLMGDGHFWIVILWPVLFITTVVQEQFLVYKL